MPGRTIALSRNDSLTDALRSLDLSDGEIRLYRACIEAGPLPLAKLAAKLHISRPNVYKLVHGLAARGLAQAPAKNSTSRFSVASPTRVAELIEDKRIRELGVQNELLRSLPSLLSTYRRGDLPSGVRVFQGRQHYTAAFFAMLGEADGTCDYLGSVDAFLKLIDREDQVRWLEERVRRGISVRTLTLPGPEGRRIAKEDSRYLRETRFIDLDPFAPSFHVCADKVIFWQPENLLAIAVEDDLIATMFRSMFDFFWARGRKPD